MRRSKSPLPLMELMVMLPVFALAAALCLQAFVKADRLSRRGEARDRAVALCQSVAEVIQNTNGDFEQAAAVLDATSWQEDALSIFYGADWSLSEAVSPNTYPFGYTLGVHRLESNIPGLGKASVWLQEDETDQELFRLEVCWQEVISHG